MAARDRTRYCRASQMKKSRAARRCPPLGLTMQRSELLVANVRVQIVRVPETWVNAIREPRRDQTGHADATAHPAPPRFDGLGGAVGPGWPVCGGIRIRQASS
jgi:hypothetical protein